jgi:hypothetical protein
MANLLLSRRQGSQGNRKQSGVDRSTDGGRRRRCKVFVTTPVFAASRVSNTTAGNQLRETLRRWQSPPDPSTNHNIASDRQHEGTAEWFIRDDKYEEWRATGSLLWIHGKRTLLLLAMSSVI